MASSSFDLSTIIELSGKPGVFDFARRKRARYRHTEHSSSDFSDAGMFLISNVKFRVGAPPPQPLPVESGWSIACTLLQEALGTSLQDQAETIAKAEGVEPLSVELVARFVPGSGSGMKPGAQSESDSRRPTILIVAKWNEASPSIWAKIVKKTKKFVDSSTRGGYLLQDMVIGVEMIAEELTLTKYITPVPASELTEALCTDWQHITEKVLDILDTYPSTKSRVTSIALLKLGFSKDFDKNPLTVYISVDYESEESKWPPVVGEIQQLLNGYHHNLHVHMEHNTSGESYAKFQLVNKPMTNKQKKTKINLGYDPDRQYNKFVGLGEDIGPERYIKLGDSGDEYHFPGLGTLGCWIEMKTIKEPQWTKYALTNYHVVRPAFDGFQIGKNDNNETIPLAPVEDSDLWKVDLKGMSPNFASKKAGIEHPTRAKHCFAVQLLTEEIEKNPNDPDTPESREHLNNIKSFFDNNEQHIGSIYCASGYTRRTRNDGRLDWALIKPTGTGVARVGKNTLPTRADWHKKGYISSKPRARGSLKQPPSHGLRSVPNGDPIFKLGTTTGATGGVFSWLKPKVNFVEDTHVQAYMDARHRPYLSNEFLFIGYPNPAEHWLAKKGDSGSVVFDTDGRAVGLLFRGHMVQQAASSYAYITPIEDVFDDIKTFSNQQITDIRIAEDS
ncbi:hypothetical protein B0T25DRAFT_61230 [Lasiosphaeria hispida]|uniref:Peptidase S7 domain-containing protein n=1 Tax=Lasiosphaeria hispida TaxID=260671 RepID=A0AAJ0HWS0_9PEZI|nr:hypothetical protein B0T25DRAFT_61230 [Lasiosphaeria hispida]